MQLSAPFVEHPVHSFLSDKIEMVKNEMQVWNEEQKQKQNG